MTFPTNIKEAWAIVNSRVGRAVVLGVVGLLVGWYLLTQVQSCRSNREITQDKIAIANKADAIANKTAQIEQLKQDRAQDVGELQVLTNSYQAANITDARAKEEVQQAVANLAATVNSNVNAVNARVEDVNKKLDQLGIE